MTNEEIKSTTVRIYADMRRITEELTYVRSICKHSETFQGSYSPRVGQILPAEICSSCGEIVRILGL